MIACFSPREQISLLLPTALFFYQYETLNKTRTYSMLTPIVYQYDTNSEPTVCVDTREPPSTITHTEMTESDDKICLAKKRNLERTATVISNKRMVTFIGDAGFPNAPVGGIGDQKCCVNRFNVRRLKCCSLKMAACCASRCSFWFHPTNAAGDSTIPISLGSLWDC